MLAGQRQHLAGSGRGARRGDDLGAGADLLQQLRQRRRIDAALPGMEIEMPRGELRQLGEAAGERQPRHRMAAQVFERAADEIAHVDERRLRQVVETLHRLFRGRAGGGGEMLEPRRARDIDAAVDRMDPGGAGIGHDDAGRAEDGEAADDPEPAVERLRRKRLAAGDREPSPRDRRGDRARPLRRRPSAPARSWHAARRLMAGSPTASGSPGRVTGRRPARPRSGARRRQAPRPPRPRPARHGSRRDRRPHP